MQVRVKNPASERFGERGTANADDWLREGYWIRVAVGAHRCMFHRNSLEVVSAWDTARTTPRWSELWV